MTPSATLGSSPDSSPTVLRWLNSVRALGVVLVLIYHFAPDVLPGGFIGVDIFFVVSGYLITALLVRELEDTGHLRLLEFWRRRWRRLFPAVVAMVLVSLVLALSISSDFRAGIALQSTAVLTWLTNFLEIATGQSYEAQLLPHLFVHTWTLAVEMQFYLIWAALVALVAYLCRATSRRLRSSDSALRVALAVLAAVLAVISLLLMQIWSADVEDPTVAYLATPSHFYPLMIGSLAGCLFGFRPLPRLLPKDQSAPGEVGLKSLKLVKLTTALLAVLGVAALIAFSLIFSFEDPRVYQWGLLATSLITALLLCIGRLWQGFADRAEPVITNYIGVRSYGIYLFHWPLVVFTGQWALAFESASGWDATAVSAVFLAVGVVATFVLAELSFRFVEQPFRASKGAKDPLLRSTVYRVTVGVVAALLLVGSAVAVVTAPGVSSIEASLEQGAEQLQQGAADPAPDTPNEASTEPAVAEARVTLIGDSVVLGAVDEIKAQIPGIDIEAQTSLKLSGSGLALLKQKADQGELGNIVVLAVGTNKVSEKDIDEALAVIGERQLVFVNAYRGTAAYIKDTNAAIANAQATHANQMTVVDWYGYVQAHPDIELAADKCHLTASSAADYAKLVADGVDRAKALSE